MSERMTESEIRKALECCKNLNDEISALIDSKNAEIKSKDEEIRRLTDIEMVHRQQNGELREELKELNKLLKKTQALINQFTKE